ncbi:hypothetical protein GWK47_046557 [Chionoecetes opilio]|uniref:Uncharacterized protein n=1 Tax=Chionoecetes opilio TaxID=41210 RepID=A0A8J5CX49_CHIOP|nr:hypothetical protein GWK47_046557 [Chionoecetes opilio]
MQSEPDWSPPPPGSVLMARRVAKYSGGDVEAGAEEPGWALTQGIGACAGTPSFRGVTGPWGRADVPAPTYMLPPVGAPRPRFTATQLGPPVSPVHHPELRQHALRALAQVADGKTVYTSLTARATRGNGRTVPRSHPGGDKLSLWRLSNNSPHSRLSWWPPARPRTSLPAGGNCGNHTTPGRGCRPSKAASQGKSGLSPPS